MQDKDQRSYVGGRHLHQKKEETRLSTQRNSCPNTASDYVNNMWLTDQSIKINI